jgi:hypothetical protein
MRLSEARMPKASTVLLTVLLAFTATPCQAEAVADAPSILRSDAATRATEYDFSREDHAFLEAIQRGCFQYLWHEVHPTSYLVKDRREAPVCSIAGVGYQLAALPIAVERGWITREQAVVRAERVLTVLTARHDNRKFGVFLHFMDLKTAGILPDRRSDAASTVDHSIFLAGAITAAEYFGGEIADRVNELVEATNWKAFDVSDRDLISFGWRPSAGDINGPGDFLPNDWHLSSDEEHLVYFLAAGAPNPDHAGDPRDYYRLERHVKEPEEGEPYVVSWNGSLFTYFFAHVWIDYRSLEADDPRQFGVDAPRVDWFENSHRATLAHRARCIDAADRFKTLAEDHWGLAPCIGMNELGHTAYLVQGLRPNIMDRDEWHGGTVAPYAAGTTIMFTPEESLAALRAYRELKADDGHPLVWRDPDQTGYAFADSFNLDYKHVSDDNIAIDVGPMLIAIENARTGLPWRMFMQSATAKRAVAALCLQQRKNQQEETEETESAKE